MSDHSTRAACAQSELEKEAHELGVSVAELVANLLDPERDGFPAPRNGKELVEYWERKEVIGMRPDIEDSQAVISRTGWA